MVSPFTGWVSASNSVASLSTLYMRKLLISESHPLGTHPENRFDRIKNHIRGVAAPVVGHRLARRYRCDASTAVFGDDMDIDAEILALGDFDIGALGLALTVPD